MVFSVIYHTKITVISKGLTCDKRYLGGETKLNIGEYLPQNIGEYLPQNIGEYLLPSLSSLGSSLSMYPFFSSHPN